MRFDKGACLVAFSALLTLGSMSFLFCPTAQAGNGPQAVPASPAPPAAAAGDGDGDELLEHWGDPQYSREERVQIVGLSLILTVLGAGGARSRYSLRKNGRHG